MARGRSGTTLSKYTHVASYHAMLGYGPNQTMVDYGNLLLKASGKPRSSIYADPMLAQVGRHSCKRGLAASLPEGQPSSSGTSPLLQC